MTSSGSRTLITDFDGTLVQLAVDWHALRAELGVERVSDVVRRDDARGLALLRDAEVAGAVRGHPNADALTFAETFSRLVVFTNNSEAAVHAFLKRQRTLAVRCAGVLGRETHRQQKQDGDVFAEMVKRGCALLDAAAATVTYLGDEPSELALAAGAGLSVIDVASLRSHRSLPPPVSDL